uniref:DUF3307 domain-containing protein n=1 Tax=viral metagenome TaxID=1070528 RepID=A0A6M3J149_9ZZZZ
MDYLILVWVHFFADFVLQSDKMALNKSSKFRYLALHCFVYLIPFLFFGIWFAIVNGVLHLIVDFVSSRVTTYLWRKEERHWFFVVIGLDQAIHITCLMLTIALSR